MDSRKLGIGEWLWLDNFTDENIIEIVSGEVECYIYDKTPESSLGRYYIGMKTGGSYLVNTGESMTIRSLCIATVATEYRILSVADVDVTQEFCQKINTALGFIDSWGAEKLQPKIYKEIILGQKNFLASNEYLKTANSSDAS